MTPAGDEPGGGPEPTSDPGPDPGEGDDGVRRTWTREDLKRSAVAGVAAYLAGYGLTFLWFLTQGRVASEFVDWRWVGWIFYHGQFVPLDAAAGGSTAGAARVVEGQLGSLSNVVPALLLSVVAVGVAGFLLARARSATEPEFAAKTGTSLVVGYLPLVVLGVFVFGGSLPNGVHVQPSPLWSPIVAGLLFPGVVGSLGALTYVYWERRDGENAARPTSEEAPDAEPPDARP